MNNLTRAQKFQWRIIRLSRPGNAPSRPETYLTDLTQKTLKGRLANLHKHQTNLINLISLSQINRPKITQKIR